MDRYGYKERWVNHVSVILTSVVIPAQAGIQLIKNVFCLTPLDSRLRGNDSRAKKWQLHSAQSSAALKAIVSIRKKII